jgi:phosphoribosylaminoimidazole-succinocarboxamide synthase
MPQELLFESKLTTLPLLRRGKVRDIYAVGSEHLLIVATDRLSAFDVVLPTPIPGKGEVLTALSDFWFRRMSGVVRNQLTELPLREVLPDEQERAQVEGRAIVVRRLQPLPIEAIVRGYLVGSGWKDYQRTGSVCGIALPQGLRLAERLPEPIFTPSTKGEPGEHDENISLERTAALLGGELAQRAQTVSLALYTQAAAYAAGRGIIIADSKFEFGLDSSGELLVIDELLTPDSSRFWPADHYTLDSNPPSFDKQYVRDYLETIGWDKRPPAPTLPAEVVARTAEKYREAWRRLTGRPEMA